ncbi:hypothetical protein CBR_g24371 [Chara braunii]|uniref:Reverse transcriptase domain-containing protein n=1 Tax=Chara braunii TaxID=69332 RepID=A0A388JMQ0_CHABU|nr:hypothetical protein CBR_g24371 [Chara braunii]|eukprot:GBG59023.1 hypothetical protein CBR_g24371 [Chara braunii]
MPRILFGHASNKVKLYVSIVDVRLTEGKITKLEAMGMRLSPLAIFAEARKQELSSITISPLMVTTKEQEGNEVLAKGSGGRRKDEGTSNIGTHLGKERGKHLAIWDALQHEKSEQWAERLKVKGLEVYDKMSKESFQKLVPARTTQVIKELKHPFDKDAPTATQPNELCNYAVMYYRDILTSRRIGEGANLDLMLGAVHWVNTTVRLLTEARLDLDRPITKEEAEEAFKVMANSKITDNDGLPVKFYTQHWEVLAESLIAVYNEIQIGGKFPVSACRGIISLLVKKGDTNEIRNWRPISLLNISYKIFAKVLVRRLGRYLPRLVADDQAAFVQGRSIYDNIVTLVEALEVVNQAKLEVTILMLDMEKSYNRVNWSYVLFTMKLMNFGDPFCMWVVALYSPSTASVMVNAKLQRTTPKTKTNKTSPRFTPRMGTPRTKIAATAGTAGRSQFICENMRTLANLGVEDLKKICRKEDVDYEKKTIAAMNIAKKRAMVAYGSEKEEVGSSDNETEGIEQGSADEQVEEEPEA